MPLSHLRPWVCLWLLDLALLWLLQGTLGALLPGGLPGLWLEGVLRLGGLWKLLKLGALLDFGVTLLPLLCLVMPLFLSLRALVPGALSAPPVRVASAPWSWLLASYGATALSWAVWAILSFPGAQASAQERKQGQENKQLMWRLLKLSRPDLPFLIAAFFFLVIAVVGEMIIPLYSGRVIDILRGNFDPEAFASAIFFMCLFSFGSLVSSHFSGDCILCLVFLPALSSSGELNSRLSSDTTLMSNWLPFNANVLLRSLVKVVGLYCFMFSLSPQLTLLSLLNMPLSLAADKVYNARHQALLREIQDAMAKGGQIVQEAVGGLQTVRSFGAEEHEVCRYKEALEHCQQLWWRRDLERALYLLFRRLLELAVHVLMLSCGLQQILAGELTQGRLLSFLLYQEDVAHHVFVYVGVCCLKINQPTDKQKCYLKGSELGFLTLPWILQGLSFTLYPGQVTALLGPNGSGKSTIAALLQNLYQPTGGRLLLDGEPISQYEHHYLHRKVALVGQEPVLFSGSVRDNIAYGLENCKDEEVMAAAKAAHADTFIEEMEHGIHTDIGEKGNQLAMGQKQRLAIARALVRDPQILILDEATSALDFECEQQMQNWRAGGSRTVLVIAHRLHTVQNADQTLVLKQGELQDHA
ncbi:antigen peptide transporter 2 [Orycteropus afer afer]|uniref:Antigen peptide transporter 2 n=1 Tax=Orycteropus afer afer TaxID=1230840 RepID=A0AC54ZEE3_ORYAF|nr:antigen peptide transporter 2 [Orycteropus afer afer]